MSCATCTSRCGTAVPEDPSLLQATIKNPTPSAISKYVETVCAEKFSSICSLHDAFTCLPLDSFFLLLQYFEAHKITGTAIFYALEKLGLNGHSDLSEDCCDCSVILYINQQLEVFSAFNPSEPITYAV